MGATGTDLLSADGSLLATIVLDFLTTESPDTWKIGLSMQLQRENPTLPGVYSSERTLIARSSAIPAEKEAKWSRLTPR